MQGGAQTLIARAKRGSLHFKPSIAFTRRRQDIPSNVLATATGCLVHGVGGDEAPHGAQGSVSCF